MKNKKSFLKILCTILFSLLIGCGDNKDKIDPQIEELFENLTCTPSYGYGQENEIVGEWQLVLYEQYGIEKTTDFSCDYILYRFDSNQKVAIASNINFEWTGEYDYEYSIPDNCPLCLPFENLQIGDSYWYSRISESTMRIIDTENKIIKLLIRKK